MAWKDQQKAVSLNAAGCRKKMNRKLLSDWIILLKNASVFFSG
jgi:hypothetical protein